MKDVLDKDDILLMNVLFSNMNEELPGRIQSMTQEIMEEDKRPAGRIHGGGKSDPPVFCLLCNFFIYY